MINQKGNQRDVGIFNDILYGERGTDLPKGYLTTLPE
jgi:hypothetical protein